MISCNASTGIGSDLHPPLSRARLGRPSTAGHACGVAATPVCREKRNQSIGFTPQDEYEDCGELVFARLAFGNGEFTLDLRGIPGPANARAAWIADASMASSNARWGRDGE
jgi:hypothetical protein